MLLVALLEFFEFSGSLVVLLLLLFEDLLFVFDKYHLRRFNKAFLHLEIRLRTRLHEQVEVVVLAKFLSLLYANFSFELSVGLIAHKNDDCARVARLAHLLCPPLQVLEGCHTRYAISEKDALSASVEYFCD